MTTKTCIDRGFGKGFGEGSQLFMAMQAALHENPENLSEEMMQALASGKHNQLTAQAMTMVNVQALSATPKFDIRGTLSALSDHNEMHDGLTEHFLMQLSPVNRTYVIRNGLQNDLVQVQLALVTKKLWQNGRGLRISFLGGQSIVKDRVKEWALQWEKHVNLQFEFLDSDNEADIRIAFQPGGSWSYIGTDASLVPQGQPTMNFGWLTPSSSDDTYSRVVLHEFGHALGAIHEHQHPEGNIPWDREAVYTYYGGAPNHWSREQVEINLFQKYDGYHLNYSAFDPASIMLYPIANDLTLGDWEVGWNANLSEQDKRFMNENYPFDDTNKPDEPIPTLVLNAPPLASAIKKSGQIQKFRFVSNEEGHYCFETFGNTDVFMSLFTANNLGVPIAEDDDSGDAWNAKLFRQLEPGEYEIQIKCYDAAQTGPFTIRVI